MKLKTVEVAGKTYAEISDGKPLFIGDDGKEVAVDIAHTTAKISQLNSEAKGHRERAESAEGKLKAFDGITDAAAAIKALETVKNIKDGELIAAGKVEEIKFQAKKAAEEQVAAANKASAEEVARVKSDNEKLNNELDSTVIGGGFARSKLIVDPKHPMSLVIPADIAEARFRKNFKREDGRVVGYDNSGNKIFSRAKPGEVADFDEALEVLVDQYPYKDQITRGTGARGDGARPNNGANNGGRKTITREAFSKLQPAEQRAASIGKDAMTIVD